MWSTSGNYQKFDEAGPPTRAEVELSDTNVGKPHIDKEGSGATLLDGGSKTAANRQQPSQRESKPWQVVLLWCLPLLLLLVLLLVALLVHGGNNDNVSNGVTPSPIWWEHGCAFDGHLLPEGALLPLQYNWTLYLTPQHFSSAEEVDTFDALVKVNLQVLQDTSCAVFNSEGLEYKHVWLEREGDEQPLCLCGMDECSQSVNCSELITIVGPGEDGVDPQLVVISMGDEVLAAGSHVTLTMQYQGQLGVDEGLWRSDPFVFAVADPLAFDVSLSSEVLVTTEGKAAAARQILPCYDEPRFKAVFVTQVQAPPDKVVLANMEEVWSGPGEDMPDGSSTSNSSSLHVFAATPPMSAYLLAVAAGSLQSQNAGVAGGMNVTVWGVPARTSTLSVAVQVASGAADFYTNWTGVKLPLTKLDLVAVPGRTFAKENWGLLMFDEYSFMWDPNNDGSWQKWLVADIVCHEVAHQWFGDYVSCRDWGQLALNEGVASFMEYKCVEAVFPYMPAMVLRNWATTPSGEDLGEHAGPRAQALAQAGDPLVAPILNAPGVLPDVTVSADLIVLYSKTAAFLAMLESFLTEDVLKAGLTSFLQEYALSSANMSQLMSSVAVAAREDPTSFWEQVQPWFTAPSYPLLNVTGSGAITQQPANEWMEDGCLGLFPDMSNGSDGGAAEVACGQDTHWWVPVSLGPLYTSVDMSQSEWLELESPQEVLPYAFQSSVDANSGGTGLYRVAYPDDQLDAVIRELGLLSWSADAAVMQLPESSEDALLGANAVLVDLFALAAAGQVSPIRALEAATAALGSSSAMTGLGAYLLALPVVEGFRQLAPLAATCRAAYEQLLGRLLIPVAAQLRLEQQTSPGFESSQAAFLAALAQPSLLTGAAIRGDDGTAAALCGLTPLLGGDLGPATCVAPQCQELRSAAYQTGVAYPTGCGEAPDGGFVYWQFAYDCVLGRTQDMDAIERHRCLYALPATTNSSLVNATLQVAFNLQETMPMFEVQSSDSLAVLRLVSERDVTGSSMAWSWVQDNWGAVRAWLGSSVCLLLEHVSFTPTEDVYQQLAAFLNADAADCPTLTKEKVLGRVRQNMLLAEDWQEPLCAFIEASV